MAYDGRATDKRRIQDNDGDVLNVNTDGSLIVGGSSSAFQTDDDGALLTKDCETYQVSNGEAWYGEMYVSNLSNGGKCTLGISVGTTGVGAFPHGRIAVSVSGAGQINFKEDATYTGGDAVTIYNINRRSAKTPDSVTLVSQPTVTDEGTRIESYYLGTGLVRPSGNAEPGAGDSVFWILKSGTKYVITVVNQSGTFINVKISYQFHEHDIN